MQTQSGAAKAQTSARSSRTSTSSRSKSSTAKKAAAPTTHKIKSGESLSTIARKHGVTVDQLRKANNLKGDNIRAGETLKVPSKSTSYKGKSSSSKKRSKKRRR